MYREETAADGKKREGHPVKFDGSTAVFRMNPRLALFFYNLLFPFALLFMLPRLALRMARRGNFRNKFGQRLGRYDAQTRSRLADGARIWIHSISVGETFLALKLARKMKALDPALKVALSATTSTGFALAEKHAVDWLEVIYNPLDAPPFVRRALNIVRPRELIFIEAMWPNLLFASKKRGIPVAMIPRLSQRSGARFRKARFFTGGFFGAPDCLCAQEAEDVPRLLSVGADAARIHVTGAIKFDQADDCGPSRAEEFRGLVRALGVGDGAPILLAGSTFAGEEKILATLFLELRDRFPSLFLILVPRHVERIPEIVGDLKPLGLRIVLRTAMEKGAAADCLIVNTTGELRDWYHVGTVVFIGKSLTSFGGQNPAEAIAANKPAVFGPHMENFANIARTLLEHRAAIQVADATELKDAIARLLADGQLRRQITAQAGEILSVHRGATERAASQLLKLRTRS